MSVDISSKMMVGAWVEDILEVVGKDSLDEILDLINDEELEYASPYYDSSPEQWFVGKGVPDTSFSADWKHEIAEAGNFMKNLDIFYGKNIDWKLACVPHVY